MDIDKIINEAINSDVDEGAPVIKKRKEVKVLKEGVDTVDNADASVKTMFESFDTQCVSSAICAGLGSKTLLERMRNLAE